MGWFIVVVVFAAGWLAWLKMRGRRKHGEALADRAFLAPAAQTVLSANPPDRVAQQSDANNSSMEVEPAAHTDGHADELLASPGSGYLPTALHIVSEDEHPLPRRMGERGVSPDVSSEAAPVPPLQITTADRSKPRRRQKQALAVEMNDRLLFLDVETTGLSKEDRIVSIGMVRVLAGDLIDHGQSDGYSLAAETMHLVFNPERPSNPFAQRVHGWPDEVLARQALFDAHASSVGEFLRQSDVWIAHNLAFDLRFIRQEFKRLSLPVPRRGTFCTMEHAKVVWEGETAKLDQCVRRIGLARAGERHGALEDAILCAALYTHYHLGKTFKAMPICGDPTNLR